MPSSKPADAAPVWPHLLFGVPAVGLFLFAAFFILSPKRLDIGVPLLVFAILGAVMWHRSTRSEGAEK